MRITNRTNKTVTIITSTSNAQTAWGVGATAWIVWTAKPPNTYWQGSNSQHSVYVLAAPGEHKQRDSLPFDIALGKVHGGHPPTPKAYLNTHSLLIVDGCRHIVDWSNIRDRYITRTASISGGADPAVPDPAAAAVLNTATALCSAISTSMSALGAGGSVPAGIFSLIASMLNFEQGDPPPPPPKLKAIEDVVKRVVEHVVEENFAKSSANDAAITFLNAHNWLLAQDMNLRSAGKRKGHPEAGAGNDPDALATIFIDELKGFALPSSDLTHKMVTIRSEPETAKWIIPAFIAGIGAYLHIWRLYELEKASSTGLSPDTIELFQTEVDACRNALLATAQAWNRHCDKILDENLIGGTPEGVEVKAALTRAYAGTNEVGPRTPNPHPPRELPQDWEERTDPTPVGQALWSLKQAHNLLAEDLALLHEKKRPRHFWKDDWYRGRVPATH